MTAAPDDIVVRGCRFPRSLLYDVPHHMWYAPLPDGTVRLGMTAVGPASLLDNQVYAFTPKRKGRPIEAGRSCGTIESGKWAGPVRAAFDGTVVDVNETLIEQPHLMVLDPYGAGWMLIVRPDDASVLTRLTPGDALAATYERWMDEHEFPGCASRTG
jgi:glycine cleavage system H protein